MPRGKDADTSLSTDSRAVAAIVGMDHAPTDLESKGARWGTIETQGCYKPLGADIAGLGTRCAVMCGVKVLFLARYNEDDPASWEKTEVVVLKAGDEL